jgi:large subunit ribosomal protein L5
MAKKTDTKPGKETKAKAEPKGKPETKGAPESKPQAEAERGSEPKPRRVTKARLREHYAKIVVPALKKEFGYKNPMAVPKIEKVAVNIGLGEATGNSKLMDGAVNELAAISRSKACDHQSEKVHRCF